MNFEQATLLMQEDKFVRRFTWSDKNRFYYIGLANVIYDNTNKPAMISVADILTNDWEIFHSNLCEKCRKEKRICGQAYTMYKCQHCELHFTHHNTCKPKLCNGCSKMLNFCRRCMVEIK